MIISYNIYILPHAHRGPEMPTEWLLNKDSHYANSMGKKRDKLRSNLYDLNSPYKVNQFALLDDLLVKKNDAKSIGR